MYYYSKGRFDKKVVYKQTYDFQIKEFGPEQERIKKENAKQLNSIL